MLGIYLHIPFCKSKCAYCDFVSHSSCPQSLYINSLKSEISHKAKEFSLSKVADTVYIGGGTPSMLKAGYLTEIFNCLRQNFIIEDNAEITVEANPDSVTKSFLDECVLNNVNRLSIGLQSANDEILKKVNRPHSYKDFTKALGLINASGINNINIDIMLGLPDDTLSGVKTTLKKVLQFNPSHISMYALKIEEGTQLYESGYFIDEDCQAKMYSECLSILNKADYQRYEVSNFCKNGKISRHNFKYWTRENYIGFGVSAHSFYGECRYENTRNTSKYNLKNWLDNKQNITKSDAKTEAVMLALRTSEGLNLQRYLLQFGENLLVEKSAEIDNLTQNKLIMVENGYLKLTYDAFYVMNAIILKLI